MIVPPMWTMTTMVRGGSTDDNDFNDYDKGDDDNDNDVLTPTMKTTWTNPHRR